MRKMLGLFTKTFLIFNKIDLPDAEGRIELFHELCPTDLKNSDFGDRNDRNGELRDAIYKSLGVLRVYTKSRRKRT